jgi:excinuclease ABC subunit B
MVVDESHVTLSVHAMQGYTGSRKENLVEYGFRLPAVPDNRPQFEEFEDAKSSDLCVSYASRL